MNHKKSFLRTLWDNRLLMAMLAPAVIYFVVFEYVPMAGLVLAFKRYDFSLGIFGSPWVDSPFKNFEFLFKSGKLLELLVNTMLYNIVFIFVGLVCQVIISVILAEIGGRLYKKLCQTFVFLPYFVSMVVVGSIIYSLLNYKYGFVNNILSNLGLEKINFYADAAWWPLFLVLVNTWKTVGYGSVVYLATITGIDSTIHEAAKIDGAGILQRIRYITIPCLKPTMITLTLMNVGAIFRGNFEMFWNVIGQNSLLFETTDVIDTYVYRSLMTASDYGMSAAAGMMQSVLCFFMIVTVNAIVKKISEENALF